MQYALAAAALVGFATALPQGGPPPSPASPSCSDSYDGTFEIQVVNVTSSSKRSLDKRQGGTPLMLTLSGGILKDAKDRTGYIASNHQFQFDPKPQPNALISSGFAVCPNNTLVLGSDAVFKECASGDINNLYDDNAAAQCYPVYIEVINGNSGSTGSSPASQQSDGQVTATAGAVTQITDGQVQATSAAAPVTQISDGQPQAGAPVTQIGDGQPQAPVPTGAPVTQISDGQPQAGAPVTQIGDGQPQAPVPTGAPVTQIGDGQPQAPVSAPVTQIGDGQPQAPVPTGAPVTQIGDGQPQAPTGSPVAQIGDGQVQAQNGSAPASPTPQAYTGAGVVPTIRSELFALAAGVLAVAML